MVKDEPVPPVTVLGVNEIPVTFGGMTVCVAVGPAPAILAVIVAVWLARVGEVGQEKLKVVEPAATVMEAGVVTKAVLSLVRVTTRPPAGAGALMVIVPVEFVAPVMDGLLNVNAVTVVGVIVRAAVFEEEPTVAVVPAPVAWPVRAAVVVTV
jgi:hypothetical protein